MKHNKTPSISVIIVTYNGLKWVDQCLSSLLQSSIVPHIIVIDNGSTDGTREKIKKDFQRVELVESPENLWFGRANNVGMKISIDRGDDYVFLLNQDAWVEANTLEQLTDVSIKWPQYGILSPTHLNKDYEKLDYAFSKYVNPDSCPGFYSDIYLNKMKPVYETDFVNAAAWLITKECLLKIGFFDPLFLHYGEDKNYCQRVLFHKLKIGVCPHVKIIHDRGERPKNTNKGLKQTMRKLLINLADINKQDFRKKYYLTLLKYLGDVFKNAILMKKVKVIDSYKLFTFLAGKKQEIVKSRLRNTQHCIKH